MFKYGIFEIRKGRLEMSRLFFVLIYFTYFVLLLYCCCIILLCFANSKVYGALFDYDTGIWKESPDYLLSLYDYCNSQKTA